MNILNVVLSGIITVIIDDYKKFFKRRIKC